MFLINALMEDISVGTAGLVALLGYAVVFIGLIALMVVVMIMGKVMSAKKTAPAAAPAAATAAPAPAPENASSITSATAKPLCSWPSSPTSSASPSIPCASNR